MTPALLALIFGLALLIWSADRFVDGAAATARFLGMPPLLIGMVVVGFGTSAPEMLVSALAALQSNPGIALGNAYGSNISNIALILGITAMVQPISVQSRILRTELPLLAAVTLLAALQLADGSLSRFDAWVLLIVFSALMGWSIRQGRRRGGDPLGSEIEEKLTEHPVSRGKALLRLATGLVLLVAASRMLVWGAVIIARGLGISDLVIGLTVVAVGTSLPELASSIAAARKGEHDIALGNVLGSNLFNTLAVVGIAGVIHPMSVAPEVLWRDMPAVGLLTLSLFVLGYRRDGAGGNINRREGGLLLAAYCGYNALLLYTTFGR
ncbi:MAG: calcium/sodium antiporter [Deltaproteobacteria bacterium]|nr:calcium/sodium antiporter [Candidatus Anaeroferrophillacea bacterium]